MAKKNNPYKEKTDKLNKENLLSALHNYYGTFEWNENKKERDSFLKKMHILNKKRIEKNKEKWEKERSILSKEYPNPEKLKNKVFIDLIKINRFSDAIAYIQDILKNENKDNDFSIIYKIHKITNDIASRYPEDRIEDRIEEDMGL